MNLKEIKQNNLIILIQKIIKIKTRPARLASLASKVSVVITAREGSIVGARAMPGNPNEGHQLQQVEVLTGYRLKQAFADRGYRASTVPKGCTFYLAGQIRGVRVVLKRWIERRSAIEPHPGHIKSDGQLGCCHLKGVPVDAMHAVLCSTAHNLRLQLHYPRNFYAY